MGDEGNETRLQSKVDQSLSYTFLIQNRNDKRKEEADELNGREGVPTVLESWKQ